MTQWKDIVGYEGRYQVGDNGQVRALYKSRDSRILHPIRGAGGTVHVVLYKKGKRVQINCQKLVAEAFLPNPESLPQLLHLNGDKTDNRASNLRWVANGKNYNQVAAAQKRVTGRRKQVVNGLQKVRQFDLNTKKTIAIYDSLGEAKRALGVESWRSDISSACNGKQRSAFGYGWELTNRSQLFGVGQYKNGKLLETFRSQAEVLRMLGKQNKQAMRDCLTGKRKTYCGFEWKPVELNVDTPVQTCVYCGNSASFRYTKGLCTACYQRLRKTGDIRLKCLTGPHSRGLSDHPLKSVWVNMKTRCYNKHNKNYPRYGGRGIKICDRWLEQPDGFWNFVEDLEQLGERPEGWSLDRIDVNGDYCIENVRWASPTLQANNRRNSSASRGVIFDRGRYRAYIDHQGTREYSPRFQDVRSAIEWRAAREKEYGLVGELGEYEKTKAEREMKKREQLSGMQDKYMRQGTCSD